MDRDIQFSLDYDCLYFIYRIRITVIVLIAVAAPIGRSSRVRYVDWFSGNNTVNCLSSSNQPCKTLDYACTNLQNDTVIFMSPGLQVLEQSITFSFTSNISIIGQYGSALINCSEPNIGIQFINVKTFTIEDLEFQYCGMLQDSTSVSSVNQSITVRFPSALYFLNSTDVSITGTNITSSNGTGVTLFDTSGDILLENVYFSNNQIPDDLQDIPGGGGLYIELTSCTPGRVNDCAFNPHVRNNNYTIRNCAFVNNTQTNLPNSTATFLTQNGPSWQRFGFGGGISIALKGQSFDNQFTIENCELSSNRANIGAGMSLIIDEESQNNHVTISNTHFTANTAQYGGGGIEFGFFSVNGTRDTTVQFINCRFIENEAVYGGGVSFYSSRSNYSSESDNFVRFTSCLWIYNEGKVGAAIVLYPQDWVSISSGYLLTPLFQDCEFTANNIYYFHQRKKNEVGSDNVDGGIIYSNTFSLNFKGSTFFRSNSGSSILVSFGDINILENSVTTFYGNVGRRGGAISLLGHSSLIAHQNSTVLFIENKAVEIGGAVYYESTDYLDALNSRRCFLRYNEVLPVDKWNASFVFHNNTSGKYGHSIYATYLEACARASVTNASVDYNIKSVFRWKPFSFVPELGSTPHIITSDPAYFFLPQYRDIVVSPGIVSNISFVVTDILNQSLKTVLYSTCVDNCKSGHVSQSYQYITDNEMVFNGVEDSTIAIIAETLNGRVLSMEMNITIGDCPSGYYFDDGICLCPVSTPHQPEGIVACQDSTNRVKMQQGYWAGCIDNSNGSLSLVTGQCPLGYCNYDNQMADGLILLPDNCSLVSDSLCKPNNRKGVLCGECIEGYSVYFHSDRFKCEKCVYGNYGILFYILTELLPLTVIFLVIIIFDISFTSGSVASFILFAQVLDFYGTTAFGIYNVPTWITYFIKAYKFIFGFFNLDLFKLDPLSFCLWDNTTVLDVLAFKYVTTLYGLLLIGALVILMHYCPCNVLKKCRKNNYGGYAVTNGLVAFVTITYSQCAKVSFEILTRYEFEENNNLVFLSGTTKFFSPKHLLYAIPAILVLSYATIIPLVLIVEPLYGLCNVWLAKRCGGDSIVQLQSPMCWRKMTLNFKPLLDSFQHSFKDDMRVFAGMFFLYRLVISISFAFSVTATSMYSMLELIVVIMLAMHSIFQPFEKRIYNTIDTLMCANLAVINGISFYNVVLSQTNSNSSLIETLTIIQVILIYIPIVYFFGLAFMKLLRVSKFLKPKPKEETLFEPDTLPDRLLEEDSASEQPMKMYGSIQHDRSTY